MGSTTSLGIEDALRSARETRALELGPGVIAKTPAVFNRLFPGQTAVLIADPTTFRVAGQSVAAAFRDAGTPLLEPFIFADPDLYAEHRFVERLEERLREHRAIPVAVGSGTINDITKLAAHRTGRSYLCVGTAASMDGYTAFGASITYLGSKQTFTCPAPVGLIADLNIISGAPAHMASWGYADLLAKVVAGADWILADAAGAEQIDPTAWNIAQGRLRELLSDPAAVRAGQPAAIGRLTEGLVLSGFAMQAAQSSRPASGAEHQFSHLWDMQHHEHNGKAPSHGFKVGIGTLAIVALYEFLLQQDLHRLDVNACCAAWPDCATQVSRARQLLENPGLGDIATREIAAKYVSREQLREQLTRLRDAWPSLTPRLRAQVGSFRQCREMLQAVEAPTQPWQIGISPERLQRSFYQAQCIRRRFTVLDVAQRTGFLPTALESIFAPEGPFAANHAG